MSKEDLFNTPLYHAHLEAKARMVPFSGWNMPVQYPAGIIAEHEHTRKNVSIFDVSHMGEFTIKGSGSAIALDRILARDVEHQKIGMCRYNFLLNEQGGILDDLIVYRLAEEEFFLVVNAGTIMADAQVIQSQLPDSVEFKDISTQTGKIDLQGPQSAEILRKMNFNMSDLPNYYKLGKCHINGEEILYSRTGYTGELGFEFYLDAEKTDWLWKKFLEFDEVQPAGLGARDTLRLEMGYPLYGHEMNVDTTPMDTGFGAMLKPGRTFTGDIIHRQEPQKKLLGVALDSRRAAREGADVYDINEKLVGKVTSGSFAPSAEIAVAMISLGIDTPAEIGEQFLLGKPGRFLKGKVTEMPFYKNGTARLKLEN